MMPDVYLTVRMPPELEPLRSAGYTLHFGDGGTPDLPPEVRERVRGVVTNGIRGASRALIEQFPNLEIIASLGIGIDAIDLACVAERGIRVTNTPGVISNDVADLAMAMVLDRLRQVRDANSFLLRGEWLGGPFPLSRSLTGRKLGIVGLGGIGSALAVRARAFGMEVSWNGPRPKPETGLAYFPDLVAMAQAVEILVVCCSGGEATRHLINGRVMEALGPEGVLVNVARGSVVDTTALIETLDQGKLGAAALDVFEEHPRVPEALVTSSRVLLTPHLGSATHETRARMGAIVMASLADHFAGRLPQNLVQGK
jgi:lactate dehydrogenase-like 2-hydroxyacid dehydrogenase